MRIKLVGDTCGVGHLLSHLLHQIIVTDLRRPTMLVRRDQVLDELVDVALSMKPLPEYMYEALDRTSKTNDHTVGSTAMMRWTILRTLLQRLCDGSGGL